MPETQLRGGVIGCHTLPFCAYSHTGRLTPPQPLEPSGLYVKGYLLQRKPRITPRAWEPNPRVRLAGRSLHIWGWWAFRPPGTHRKPPQLPKTKRRGPRSYTLRLTGCLTPFHVHNHVPLETTAGTLGISDICSNRVFLKPQVAVHSQTLPSAAREGKKRMRCPRAVL